MSQLTAAERYLLDCVLARDADGWSQLVARYEGRLRAFARRRLADTDEAEDVVQETFIGFLQSVANYHGSASLETYLFSLLRRKIVDAYRRHGRVGDVHVCSLSAAQTDHDTRSVDFEPASPDLTASQYARQSEHQRLWHHQLANAISRLTDTWRSSRQFLELAVCDMLFYAQLRNKDVALRLRMDEKQVALIKHRALKRLTRYLCEPSNSDTPASEPWEAGIPDDLLTRVWEELRPTCPKRSTIGKWLLGTLDRDWQDYLGLHLDEIGCRFCLANREDLQNATEAGATPPPAESRIFQSTVGFLRSGK